MREAFDKVFEELVLEHQAGLRAFVRSLGVGAVSTDDIAQETILIAWKRFDAFDQERDFGRWVRGIARNLVGNEIRKTTRRRRLLDSGISEFLINQADASGDTQATRTGVLIKIMNECIAQLPEKAQSLLRKRYQSAQRATELAKAMNEDANAVRNRLMRLRGVVQKCMERKIGGEWA